MPYLPGASLRRQALRHSLNVSLRLGGSSLTLYIEMGRGRVGWGGVGYKVIVCHVQYPQRVDSVGATLDARSKVSFAFPLYK